MINAVPVIKRIGAGVLNGFPLIRSVVKSVSGKSIAPVAITTEEGKTKVDYTVLITEFITAGLVAAVVFGKISIDDLKLLIQIIKD